MHNDCILHHFVKMTAEKYFGTRNLYEILQLEKDAEIQDGKWSKMKKIV